MRILAVRNSEKALSRLAGIVRELKPDAELVLFESSPNALAEARKKEADRIEEYLQLKQEIKAAVRAVPNPRLRAILEMHFFEQKTYSEIAGILNYSEIYIRKLCQEGLLAIQIPE